MSVHSIPMPRGNVWSARRSIASRASPWLRPAAASPLISAAGNSVYRTHGPRPGRAARHRIEGGALAAPGGGGPVDLCSREQVVPDDAVGTAPPPDVEDGAERHHPAAPGRRLQLGDVLGRGAE